MPTGLVHTQELDRIQGPETKVGGQQLSNPLEPLLLKLTRFPPY